MKTQSLHSISSLFFLLIFVLAGCDSMGPETNTNPEQPQPFVPEEPPPPAPPIFPSEVFLLDLSLFETSPGKHSSDATYTSSSGNFTNFLAAALRAGAVTVINGTILTPPAIFTGALADAEPVYVEPENTSEAPSFVWEKDNVKLGTTMNGLRLVATINKENTPADTNNAGIDWHLFVTGIEDNRGQPAQDFLMLDARTNVSTLTGNLELSYPRDGASTLTMIGEYTLDPDNNFYSLAFSVPDEIRIVGGLATTITKDNTLNSLDIMTKEGIKQLIQWDETTSLGSITSDDYNNGQRACWNEELRNVPC